MYSRESVGLRMEHAGTLALTVHYCEDFTPRTKRTRLSITEEI